MPWLPRKCQPSLSKLLLVPADFVASQVPLDCWPVALHTFLTVQESCVRRHHLPDQDLQIIAGLRLEGTPELAPLLAAGVELLQCFRGGCAVVSVYSPG